MDNATYNFEPFAETEEYRLVNDEIAKWWVKELVENHGSLLGFDTLLDVATGTGTMAELFFDNMRNVPLGHRDYPMRPYISYLYLLDMSQDALNIARDKFVSRQGIGHIITVPSLIEEMPGYIKNIDIALWGNGIHYLNKDEQKEAVTRIKQMLSLNGWLFLNSAFYDGARPDWTRNFYQSQMNAAVGNLAARGVKRKKEGAASSLEFLSMGYYIQLLAECGFKEIKTKEFTANLYQEAWEHISSFSHYATGALRCYPVEESAKALKDAVEGSLEKYGRKDEYGRKYIERNWLAVAARS